MQLQHETCTIAGCDRPHKARGMCQTHYTHFKRTGQVKEAIRHRVVGRDPTCSVEGCNNPERANGMCQMHNQRIRRHGSTDFRVRWKESLGTCTIEGCDNPVNSHGLCSRHYQKQRKWAAFGVDALRYQAMLSEQNFVCAICDGPEIAIDPGTKEVRALAVDHCHETNVVRGLLCGNCNQGIGLFKDKTDVMRRAIAYLEKHRPPDVADLV